MSVFIMSVNTCTLCERVLVVSGKEPILDYDLSQHAPLFT